MRRFFRAPEIILILLAIEGVFASFLVFDIPSMEKNAFLFGYSLERILTGGIIFVLAGLFLAAGLYLLKQPDHSLRLKNSISDRLKKDSNNLLNLSIALPAISLAAFSALMILYYTPVDPLWPSLPVVVDRALAAIIWAAAVPLHLWAALLAVQFTTGGHESLKRPGAGQIISMLVLFSLTVFQWFTLLLRSEWIREVGSWFRKYRFKGLRPSHLILLLLLILSVFVVRWLLRSTARGQVKVLVVFVLGVVLLAGYGFAEGPGFDFFTNEYLISEFQLETRWACEYPGSILDAVRNYEAHFGDTLWYGTKPPGLLVLYKMAKEGLGLVYPMVKMETSACLWGVTKALAFLAPFLTFLSLFPLVYTAEQLLGKERGYTAGLLYVCIPSVLLMVLKPDQFIYPFFFSLAIFSLVLMLQKEKTWKAGLLSGFFAGSMIYTAIFVSFSLLPILGLAAAWIGLDFLAERGWEEIKPWIIRIAGLVLGFVVLWALFAVFLKYNMIQRYQLAMESHIENKDFSFTLHTLLEYARLNNVEFAFWAGMPVYFLMIFGAVRSAAAVIRRKTNTADLFGTAFLLTCLALHVVGQTRGEVGRMWIFLLPAGMILAAREACRLTRKPAAGMMLVFTLQLITANLMFLFMNWR